MQRQHKREERKLASNFPSAGLPYAKATQARGKGACFQFPERRFALCKDKANRGKRKIKTR